MKGNDELQRWPCRSSHQITVSLYCVKPLTVTLPHPILLDTLKVSLCQTDGIIKVVGAKALHDLWPEDVIGDQFRWNVDTLQLHCTDRFALQMHLKSQHRLAFFVNPTIALKEADAVLTGIRLMIQAIFNSAVRDNEPLIRTILKETPNTTEWLIRVHLPVRTSPRGAPVLLLSAVNLSQMGSQGKQMSRKELKNIFDEHGLQNTFTNFNFHSAEEIQLFRNILRFNSTKIQLTEWQKKNLPQSGDSQWLATFIQPLYFDGQFFDKVYAPLELCCYCTAQKSNMKVCGRCKAVSYCSVECQRTHWPVHKLSCSKS